MPIVLSGDEAALTLDHPIVGWQSIATPATVFADRENADFPAVNMANPATHLKWKSGTVSPANDLTIAIVNADLQDVDYIAIAGHNLGSNSVPIIVGYLDDASPAMFHLLDITGPMGSPAVLADNGPKIIRFTAGAYPILLLNLGAVAAELEISVLYCGKLLVMPRKLYQGLTPIPYGRTAKVTNGRTETGNFLGRIVLQEFVKDTIPLSLIDPAYYRNHIDAFMADNKERPFFISWRPETYPSEAGFCHMTNDPMPVNEAPHGLIAMSWEMTGIV